MGYLLPARGSAKVLELAAGDGEFSLSLAAVWNHVRAPSELTAIVGDYLLPSGPETFREDHSTVMVKRINNMRLGENKSDIPDDEDGTFDLVYSGNALCVCPGEAADQLTCGGVPLKNPIHFVRRVKRLLKEEGMAIF